MALLVLRVQEKLSLFGRARLLQGCACHVFGDAVTITTVSTRPRTLTPQHHRFANIAPNLLIRFESSKMAVLPIEQPRPTPAPATPMRLFLEGHRRRFIFILPELIYTIVGILVLVSAAIFVRTLVMQELRSSMKARGKGKGVLSRNLIDLTY